MTAQASFLDAHGQRVTATETRAGLLVILTRTAADGAANGHPCLDRLNAAALRVALTEFIDNAPHPDCHPEATRRPA